jgi:hypothetical protein
VCAFAFTGSELYEFHVADGSDNGGGGSVNIVLPVLGYAS